MKLWGGILFLFCFFFVFFLGDVFCFLKKRGDYKIDGFVGEKWCKVTSYAEKQTILAETPLHKRVSIFLLIFF